MWLVVNQVRQCFSMGCINTLHAMSKVCRIPQWSHSSVSRTNIVQDMRSSSSLFGTDASFTRDYAFQTQGASRLSNTLKSVTTRSSGAVAKIVSAGGLGTMDNIMSVARIIFQHLTKLGLDSK